MFCTSHTQNPHFSLVAGIGGSITGKANYSEAVCATGASVPKTHKTHEEQRMYRATRDADRPGAAAAASASPLPPVRQSIPNVHASTWGNQQRVSSVPQKHPLSIL